MKIGIIGGGAIGLLISSYLNHDHHVTIYVKRESQYRRISQYGITLFDENEQFQTHNIEIAYLDNISEQDIWFVSVKQYQLHDVVNYFPKNKPIIYLQNGMGHLSMMQDGNHSFIGIVEHGAKRKQDNEVIQLGKGKITIAPLTGSEATAQLIVKQLHQQHFPFYFASDWELLLKEKLIVNAIINPLTALFDVENGEINHNTYIRLIARKLCQETANTLKFDPDHYWKKITQIAKNTEKNTSSMRSDIKHHRKTEIDAISGYLLRQSNQSLPYTQFVHDAILALEERYNE